MKRVISDCLQILFVIPQDYKSCEAGITFVYIETASNYAQVFLTNGQGICVTQALKEFEQLLCKKELHFIRIHHSYIINTDYVIRYIKDSGRLAVLKGSKTIPVPRQKKEEFLRLINFPS